MKRKAVKRSASSIPGVHSTEEIAQDIVLSKAASRPASILSECATLMPLPLPRPPVPGLALSMSLSPPPTVFSRQRLANTGAVLTLLIVALIAVYTLSKIMGFVMIVLQAMSTAIMVLIAVLVLSSLVEIDSVQAKILTAPISAVLNISE